MAMRALNGHFYGYFGANYKLLTEVWHEACGRLAPVIKSKNKTENRIELITGGVIEFWTLENKDAGRSRRYHEVGIDEAGLVSDLEQLWYAAIRPTLTDFKGSAWLAGTPKGRNFFATAYALGQDPLNDEWASWRMPTKANPYIDPSEVDAAEKGTPERLFQQEYLAEFLEDAGGVFRGVTEVVDKGRTGQPEAITGPYTIGVDLARVEDFTVISVIDGTGKQIYFERFNQISWERQISRIQNVCGMFHGYTLYLDSTGVGDPIFERLRALNINVNGYQFSNTSKEALINNLAMQIEQGKARLMDIQEQTAELQAYQYELTPSRNVRMNAPAGMHDDTVIALALAFWGFSGKRKLTVY